MEICDFDTSKNLDRASTRPRFASPSTGFSRIFTTMVFSPNKFSTHSIDGFLLQGLTWTVIRIHVLRYEYDEHPTDESAPNRPEKSTYFVGPEKSFERGCIVFFFELTMIWYARSPGSYPDSDHE